MTGRAEELRLIEAAMTSPHVGIVIAGGAGVGKSRLAREALDAAASTGGVVRWAVGTASARTVPLGAFAEWTGGIGADPLHLVRTVIGAMTDGPPDTKIVVGVDDAQQLDDLSAFVLHQLALRRLATIVVTIRSGVHVPDAVTALWKDGLLDRLELQPLSRSEADGLLHTVLGGPLDRVDARRIWRLTRGNALYLRHVVEEERAAGRLCSTEGMWRWTGDPVVSPGLSELIDAQIGALGSAVSDVLDVLSVGEPLDTAVLAQLADREAIEEAESRGLVAVDRADTQMAARLAHPLYGEVRRARAGPIRLRRLRGLVAAGLATAGDGDMQDTVRRAVLSLDSDLAPEPEFYIRAAHGAMGLSDLALAERLAQAAVAAGGGPPAQLVHAQALSLRCDGDKAEDALARIPTADLPPPLLARIVIVRAANMLWTLGRPADAESILDTATAGSTPEVRESLSGFRTIYLASLGRPLEAIENAASLNVAGMPDLIAMLTTWGLVIALGDVGRADEVGPIARKGLALADRSSEASFQRFVLTDTFVGALLLAGRIAEAETVAALINRHASDHPGLPHLFGAAIAGRAALGAGKIGTARHLLHQAVTGFTAAGDPTAGYRYLLGYTQTLAMSGDNAAAATALRELDARRHPGFGYLEPEHALARAWVSAAQGALTEAVATARRAAEYAATHDQFAWEVVCLQTATQFGDRTTAPRLAELATTVEGPRAPVTAQFAASLAVHDGAGLHTASMQFEAMGDRLAAADAAAHAAIAYRHHDLRGSAITSTARSERLAKECGCATTPAIREASQPLPLTAREREIAALIAAGLSNNEIAERLSVSVRTIEGHLYRAKAKTGTRSREQLGATLLGD